MFLHWPLAVGPRISNQPPHGDTADLQLNGLAEANWPAFLALLSIITRKSHSFCFVTGPEPSASLEPKLCCGFPSNSHSFSFTSATGTFFFVWSTKVTREKSLNLPSDCLNFSSEKFFLVSVSFLAKAGKKKKKKKRHECTWKGTRILGLWFYPSRKFSHV